jgi:signal transduction histidine kinase
MKPCNLSVLIHETLEELTTIYGNRFHFEPDSEIIGNWSPDNLRRAIENLVVNAIKYGDPRQPITITIEKHGNRVDISVHNFGNPIGLEEQATLFKPFHRLISDTTSGKKGWGIGLSLVKGIAEAHGGTVKVYSTPKEGTIFALRLPYVEATPPI